MKERGYFGPLTQMAFIRLAHIKGLGPDDPNTHEKLRDEMNQLLDRMAKDDEYLVNRPLPREEDLEPKSGDPLFEVW